MTEKFWKDFVNGEFAVVCKTDDDAREFIKEAYKNNVKWYSGNEQDLFRDLFGPETCYHGRVSSTFGNIIEYGSLENCYVSVVTYVPGTKTIQEVIAIIEPGQIWESSNFIVNIDECGYLRIEHKEGFTDEDVAIYFSDDELFRLKL